MMIKEQDEQFEVFLANNGTLDTVITVNGYPVTFSQEYACDFRNAEGDFSESSFYDLAKEAIDAHIYLTTLL